MATEIPILPGIAAIADRYDGYIIDLWGVVHNGRRPYAGVVDCLERLRRADKSECLLSNAPRRVAGIVQRLSEIGAPPDCYDHVMSSGEATFEALRDRPDGFHAALGQRCPHIGPPRDNSVYDGLDIDIVDDPAAADFVLNTGNHEYTDTVADYEGLLAAAAGYDLPMVCANPDLVVVVGDTIAICAGTLAARYEQLGGRVAYHGKPYPSVYARCFEMLTGIDRARIVAVGDSFRTDIAGANATGIDSVLAAGGIHADELAATPGGPPDSVRVADAAARNGHRPTAAVAGLVW